MNMIAPSCMTKVEDLTLTLRFIPDWESCTQIWMRLCNYYRPSFWFDTSDDEGSVRFSTIINYTLQYISTELNSPLGIAMISPSISTASADGIPQ